MRRGIAIALLALVSGSARGWWADGHVLCDQAAIQILPEEMPAFFRKGSNDIAFYSVDPDLWSQSGGHALRQASAPDHRFDIELLEGLAPPPTRAAAAAMCAKLGIDAAALGTLPYAIDEWHRRLVLAFAEYRARPDDWRTRARVLYMAGVLSHYAVDSSHPLHCTVHFDGRVSSVRAPSPRTGFHQKTDALPGKLGLSPEEIAHMLKPTPVVDAFAAAVVAVRESNMLVDRLYELEPLVPPAEKPFEGMPDPAVREFILERCRAAAALTGGLWLSAWELSAAVVLPNWRMLELGEPKAVLQSLGR